MARLLHHYPLHQCSSGLVADSNHIPDATAVPTPSVLPIFNMPVPPFVEELTATLLRHDP
jgi:hypothetical protein